jgi:hypothetical protein
MILCMHMEKNIFNETKAGIIAIFLGAAIGLLILFAGARLFLS